MNITICTAISLDGFLATKDGNSDWVLDDKVFEKAVSDYGCIVLGNKTFEQYKDDLYPIKGIEHIVLTHNPKPNSGYPNVTYAESCDEAIKIAKEKDFERLLVIGGGKTNESFLECEEVSQLIVDVHPILIEDGLPAFGKMNRSFRFEQVSATAFPEGFTQIIYKVKE